MAKQTLIEPKFGSWAGSFLTQRCRENSVLYVCYKKRSRFTASHAALMRAI
jgi:hypothetical protein